MYNQNYAKTMRNLALGSASAAPPYAKFTAGMRILEFFTDDGVGGFIPTLVDLKPGATFFHDGYRACVTIQGGAGSSYLVDQPFAYSASYPGVSGWYTSDRTSAKGRNSNGNPDTLANTIAGLLVPDAIHYIYASVLDDAGNPDYYVYVDTIQPERGVHPYTRDLAIGSFKTVPRSIPVGTSKTGRPIMDLATRVRDLEGVVRAGRSAGSSVQDDRIAKLVARFAALETWANSGGHFGTPPAVGSTTVYTEDQFIQAGDQA
jgi:hypothetical protein